MKAISAHIRNNVVGYVALFFSLGGGAAWATHSTTPTIDSFDIINGQVRSLDVGNGQVRSVDVADDSTANALIGTDVAADSLTGADISGLTGADIDEKSLVAVNAATVAGGLACRTKDVLSANPGPVLFGDLCASGPLRIFPRCTDVDDTFIRAEILIDTDTDHSFYGGTTVDADFEAADPPATLLKAEDKSGAGSPEASAAMSEVIAGAEAGLGGQIAGVAAVRAERGEAGSDCQFVFYGAG